MSVKMVTVAKVGLIQESLLAFWDEQGRKELPWRRVRDPWHILVAEILLRKTTAAQVVPIYGQIGWLTPGQLMEIKTEDLETILRPLGISAIRANQLHEIARLVNDASKERLEDPRFVAELPGVGWYTQNALLCFAFGRPVPAVDTNMIRILERVLGFKSKRSRPRTDPAVWQLAETLVPKHAPREFNWAVLDLGHFVCRASKPKCLECPLRHLCLAFGPGDEN